MKIYDAPFIRAADRYTIEQGISSADLMERAARACSDQILKEHPDIQQVLVICGTGNNGGDGLCIARHFLELSMPVKVLIHGHRESGTEDFSHHLRRFESAGGICESYSGRLPDIPQDTIVIDALFGTGINRPVEGTAATLIEQLNESGKTILSVDMPSGLPANGIPEGTVIHAHHTYSFQWPKPAFFLPENAGYTGSWSILDIGLRADFPGHEHAWGEWVDSSFVLPFLKPRKTFSHKGNYGHVMLLAGSKDMPGAANLCSFACIRAGAGRVTLADDGREETRDEIMHLHRNKLVPALESGQYNVFAAGPGLGRTPSAHTLLKQCLESFRHPVLLDADALNLLADDPSLTMLLPAGSILTPHPGEFRRLAGDTSGSLEMLTLQQQLSARWQVTIVLKRAYTCITTPDGKIYINGSGNPGMATAGSGDVLTGIIAAWMAQGLSPTDAAIAGTYLHGLAGDLAMKEQGGLNIIAGDIIDHYNSAIKILRA
ncbi:MAG: NAD(P)H-hydrate dehydratase [Chitinophagales bacterium]|nr:NAD(P)H-hydrate dehydratase [Chitinophagales bacterium]MCB9021963.1 NAD(P)H-hydrate dehydratase [Chitinophagales bacterium]HPE97646.1 NAD(P)H-hydrate dehydratase [Chitinophagales bacterium]